MVGSGAGLAGRAVNTGGEGRNRAGNDGKAAQSPNSHGISTVSPLEPAQVSSVAQEARRQMTSR